MVGATIVGTGKANGQSNWSIKASPLAAGTHGIRTQVTDLAGNVSALSNPTTVTIDTTAPAIPSAPRLLATSDSGVSSADQVTNIATPTPRGTGEAGSTVSLFDGATLVGSARVNASGNWTVTTGTLADGAHKLGARAVCSPWWLAM
jgi:hypothetical protein